MIDSFYRNKGPNYGLSTVFPVPTKGPWETPSKLQNTFEGNEGKRISYVNKISTVNMKTTLNEPRAGKDRHIQAKIRANAILKSRSTALLHDAEEYSTDPVDQNENKLSANKCANKDNDISKCNSQLTSAARSSSSTSLKVTLQSDDVKYEEHLSRLQQFSKKTTQLAKKNSQKSEWLKEWKQLNTSCCGLEEDLTSQLEVLLMHSAQDQETAAHMQSLCSQSSYATDEHMQASKSSETTDSTSTGFFGYDLISHASSLQHEEVKHLLAATKVAHAESLKTASATPHGHKASAAQAIFGDLLLQMKTSLGTQTSELNHLQNILEQDTQQTHLWLQRTFAMERKISQSAEVERDLAGRPDDDADIQFFIEEWQQTLRKIDDAHYGEIELFRQELQQITKNYQSELSRQQCTGGSDQNRTDCAIADESATMDAITDKTAPREKMHNDVEMRDMEEVGHVGSFSGGLTTVEHSMFLKIVRRAHSTGMSRKLILQQYQTLLPKVPHEVILLHEKWYSQRRVVFQKQKAAVLKYDMTRAAVLNDAKNAVENYRMQHHAQLQQQQTLQEHEEARALLHEHLQLLRQSRQALQEQAAQEQLRIEQMQLAEQERLRQRQEADAAFKKKQIALFQEAKNDLLRRQHEQRAVLQKQAEQKMREDIEQNRGKVEARQATFFEKLQKERQKEAELAAREERKLQFLMELASQVPYWDDIQNATSKLDHITAAVKAQEYQGQEELVRGYMPTTGYADKQIIKDARFRLVRESQKLDTYTWTRRCELSLHTC